MTRPLILDLDFVSAPRSTWVGRGVLVAGLACAAIGAGVGTDAWLARHAEQDALAGLALEQPRRVERAPADPALLRSAAIVKRELQMPWGQLLLALERVPSHDVAVLSIEPAATQRTLRITADARHADAMLDYLAQLKQQSLTQVVLTSHQFQAQTPGTPIRFQVQARWGEGATVAEAPPVLAAGIAPTATAAIGPTKPAVEGAP
jgi:Tfp pilus assembly protein PilN